MPEQSCARVALLWHSANSGNLGVGALTLSNIRIVRDVAARLGINVEFVIVGWIDERPIYPGLEGVELTRVDRRALIPGNPTYLRIFRNCDLVVDVGAGDSFTDLYGAKRFLYQFATKQTVLFSGRPLVLAPQTLGPFQQPWTAALARHAMRPCHAVFARDELSYTAAQGLGIGSNLDLSIDVAFRLPYIKTEYDGLGEAERQPRVGVNVSGLLFNHADESKSRFSLTLDYPAFVRKVVDYFVTEGVEVHLVGHVFTSSGDYEDDMTANLQLQSDFPEVIVAPVFGDPVEAKSYIATMDFFTGARMHACIAAFSTGVPVVPVGYSRKFTGLFGSLNYDFVADGTTMDGEVALAVVVDGFRRKKELAGAIVSSRELVSERLARYEASIELILRSQIGGHHE